MRRTCLAVCFVALLAAAGGCSMCDHPYDYCGPTFTGECGQTCNPLARAGSILSPPIGITTSGAAISTEVTPVPEESTAPETPAAEPASPTKQSRSATPNRAGRWTARTASPPPQ
jgi:hypothetical protein